MLRSNKIRLIAAFNHLHIFIDPTPDAATSYEERQRLYSAERSGWSEYTKGLISPGGGVFERTAKSVRITPEMKACLGIEADELTPNELIQAILQAPVDLLWNGGIGTYVKGSDESHADVRSEEHTSELQSRGQIVCRLLLEKKK